MRVHGSRDASIINNYPEHYQIAQPDLTLEDLKVRAAAAPPAVTPAQPLCLRFAG